MTKEEAIKKLIFTCNFKGREYKLHLLYLYKIQNLTATETAEILEKKYNWKLEDTTIRRYAYDLDTEINRELAIELFEAEPEIETPQGYLYVGHYYDTENRYILKIGTTNNLKRRAAEHTRNYKEADQYTMPLNSSFVYDWYIKLSKYNTFRYEDLNRELWKREKIGEFVRNDRFNCGDRKPEKVNVKIKKVYEITLE